MQIQSILNRVQKHKSSVYEKVQWSESKPLVPEVQIRPRANSHPVCSWCRQPGPGYDILEERQLEFVPLWGMAVFFVYALRRMNCRICGVKLEGKLSHTGREGDL